MRTIDVPSEFYAKEWPERAGAILGGRSLDSLYRNDKIKSAVPSFRQKICLVEGIAKTVKAIKAEHYQKGIDWRYDADSDRIISKWCRMKRMSLRGLNIGFINYLGTANLKDRFAYIKIRYRDAFAMRLLVHCFRFLRRILKNH